MLLLQNVQARDILGGALNQNQLSIVCPVKSYQQLCELKLLLYQNLKSEQQFWYKKSRVEHPTVCRRTGCCLGDKLCYMCKLEFHVFKKLQNIQRLPWVMYWRYMIVYKKSPTWPELIPSRIQLPAETQ